jgi:CBS-domain-containing membrane protein
MSTQTTQTAHAIVGDLMAFEPVVVQANATLDEAARLLDLHGISGLPVSTGPARWSACSARPTSCALGRRNISGRTGRVWRCAT